jgi:hypothetical protein
MEGGGRLGRPQDEPLPSQHASRDGWLWLSDYHATPPAGLGHPDPALIGKYMIFGGDERRNRLWRQIVEGVQSGTVRGEGQGLGWS